MLPSDVCCPPAYIVISDHHRHFSHMCGGNLSHSLMIFAGSGEASDSTTSHSPRPITASISSVTIPRIRFSCRRTARGVKRDETSRLRPL
ncbi:MAG: hypothetical protein H6748_19585 [Spirochaetaceae bacterium]|nr:hypothetical protein [Spirochaetaceae bacterium]